MDTTVISTKPKSAQKAPKAPKAANAAKAPKALKAPKGIQKNVVAEEGARPRLQTPQSQMKKVHAVWKKMLVTQNKALDKFSKDRAFELDQQRSVYEAQVNFLEGQIGILCENNQGMKKIVLNRVEGYTKAVAKKLAGMKLDRIGPPPLMAIPHMVEQLEDVDDGHNVGQAAGAGLFD